MKVYYVEKRRYYEYDYEVHGESYSVVAASTDREKALREARLSYERDYIALEENLRSVHLVDSRELSRAEDFAFEVEEARNAPFERCSYRVSEIDLTE